MGKSKKDEKDKKRKHKKEKKSKDMKKKSKKHRKDTSGSSSSSPSDSGSDVERVLTAKQRLQQERKAVNLLRDLLWEYQSARKDLRELLWMVDQGKVANIGGVPDEGLRQRLKELMKLLGLRPSGSKGSYVLPAGGNKTLSVLGFVFEEEPRPPKAPHPTTKLETVTQAAAHQLTDTSAAQEGMRSTSSNGGDDERKAPDERGNDQALPARKVAGPTIPDAHNASAAGATKPSHSQDSEDAQQHEDHAVASGSGSARRRVAGPALPSAEMLARAAQEAARLQEEEELQRQYEAQLRRDEYGGGGYGDDDGDEDMVVGPVPDDMLQEVEDMPADAREAEVQRVMRSLTKSGDVPLAGLLGTPAAAEDGQEKPLHNAYEVLGVSNNASAADVKKRYMKLSLLIHPDKCNHKDAHTAFQAVSKAAKMLQDAEGRAAIDAARQDQELRRMAVAEAAKLEREAAWAAAKGMKPPAAVAQAVALGPAPVVREAWMTDLPPEKLAGPGNIFNQVSQRSFSQSKVKPRGDTREWTETPAQRAARAAGVEAPTVGPALLRDVEDPSKAPGSRLAAASASGVANQAGASFVPHNRKKTLLELHQEQQEAAVKKARTEDDPNKGMPWRPFDREKDLEIRSSKAVNAKDIIKNANLSSKFQSAGGTRNFL